MEFFLPALLECCVMSKADRAAEMPVKALDVQNVELKGMREGAGEATEDDAEDEDDEDNFMTLRKSAAFTLTEFSRNFNADVFHKIQPHLQKMLQSDSADLEEAAILALGCISD